jgi:hypothetical protein
MIPKEPGKFKLGDYFHWVFFNPKEKKYDTLRSKLTVFVKGESKQNEGIQSNDLGSFYDKIDAADNTLQKTAGLEWLKWVFGSFILVVLGASVYLVVRKNQVL